MQMLSKAPAQATTQQAKTKQEKKNPHPVGKGAAQEKNDPRAQVQQ